MGGGSVQVSESSSSSSPSSTFGGSGREPLDSPPALLVSASGFRASGDRVPLVVSLLVGGLDEADLRFLLAVYGKGRGKERRKEGESAKWLERGARVIGGACEEGKGGGAKVGFRISWWRLETLR